MTNYQKIGLLEVDLLTSPNLSAQECALVLELAKIGREACSKEVIRFTRPSKIKRPIFDELNADHERQEA